MYEQCNCDKLIDDVEKRPIFGEYFSLFQFVYNLLLVF